MNSQNSLDFLQNLFGWFLVGVFYELTTDYIVFITYLMDM